MIGEKVTIRIRMNTGDAHYAGDLVNGSHMLDFFGDVATELLIRMDGDEGLFRTYEHVDFLAPVYAGDFMEYVGWIESVGNTSRRMVFEAYKVKEPVLTGRAKGICVVPKNCQRGSQDPAFQV